MDYSAWKQGKLIRGLLNYRTLKTKNGRQPSWESVRDAILLSDATVQEFPEDGSEPSLKPEALRRFASGDQRTMETEKLDDLMRFLISEKLLGKNEMTDGDQLLEEALALHSRLAVTPESDPFQMQVYAPLFEARRIGGRAEEKISLRVIAKPLVGLFLLEEECRFELKAGAGVMKSVTYRQGYAFATTKTGQLSIFLKSADPRDSVFCLELPSRDTPSVYDMRVCRVGGPEILDIQPRDAPEEQQLEELGLLLFRVVHRPAGVRTVSAKRGDC